MILRGKNIYIPKKNTEAKLSIILVGSNPASEIYVRNKVKFAKKIGIKCEVIRLEESITTKEILIEINKLNGDPSVNGIIVQLPLPSHIDTNRVLRAIDPLKDVDGFHPENLGLLSQGNPRYIPATAKGIIYLLEYYKIPIKSKHAVVVGRSNIVGKPTAQLLLNKNATVTICHSKTKDLDKYTKDADILVVAVGKPGFITENMVKRGATVIDVGINRINNKLVGDCDFEAIKDKANITPVPGGVGPLTVAMLMDNVIKAAEMQKNYVRR